MKKGAKNAKPGVSKAMKKKRSQLQVQASIPGMGSGSVNWGSSQLAPMAKTRIVRSPQQPNVRQIPEGTVISHREYVADIASSTNFVVNKEPINPGNENLFLWLSDIAPNYETYHFTKLRFCFETSKSCDTNGSVMFAVDFDAEDPPPIDKQEMMSYAGAVRGAPWSEFSYNCTQGDLRKFVKERYVKQNIVPSGVDIKTYDVGNFYVATIGFDGVPQAVGEIYVEYTVVLKTPQGSSSKLPLDKFWFAAYSISSEDSVGGVFFPPNTSPVNGAMPVLGIGNNLELPYEGFYQAYYIGGDAGDSTAHPAWSTSTGNVITIYNHTASATVYASWSFYAGEPATVFTQTSGLVEKNAKNLQIYYLGPIDESAKLLSRAVRSGRKQMERRIGRVGQGADFEPRRVGVRSYSETKHTGCTSCSHYSYPDRVQEGGREASLKHDMYLSRYCI